MFIRFSLAAIHIDSVFFLAVWRVINYYYLVGGEIVTVFGRVHALHVSVSHAFEPREYRSSPGSIEQACHII